MSFQGQRALSLADRRHVSFPSDAGLSSLEGARSVIAAISSRRFVSKLTVAHNRLGADGFGELFKFLCSNEGRKYAIDEIDLHNCGIDEFSLMALSEYVRGSRSLRTLQLQQNEIGPDKTAITKFISALNDSRLRTLILSSMNSPASSETLIQVLSALQSPYLHELTLSYNGLTYASAPTIASFLRSPGCHLRILRLNANNLGYRGTQCILSAMEHNYTLTSVEMYGNNKEDGDSDSDHPTQEFTERKISLQRRNDALRKTVESEALCLLRYSRILLLRRSESITQNTSGDDISYASATIPMELQLYILSFFAPTLSDAQRVRVFKYASTSSTLPRLLPSLLSQECLRDPSSLPFGITDGRSSCSSGKCMGTSNSVMCRRESERLAWLTEVGCDAYIPKDMLQ